MRSYLVNDVRVGSWEGEEREGKGCGYRLEMRDKIC